MKLEKPQPKQSKRVYVTATTKEHGRSVSKCATVYDATPEQVISTLARAIESNGGRIVDRRRKRAVA